jgi:NTP pyrophosphatase (non-canonical NTP hydrolase)
MAVQAGIDKENAMKRAWQEHAKDIHERFLTIARAKGSLKSDVEITHFLALAICGEAGELANFVKKAWRGDEFEIDQIRDELADIRIYLEHLARHLQIDIDDACEHKLNTVAQRLAIKEAERSVATNF